MSLQATYDLEEDTSASFTAPTNVYTGASTSFNVTGKTSGTFYYRARANNASAPTHQNKTLYRRATHKVSCPMTR